MNKLHALESPAPTPIHVDEIPGAPVEVNVHRLGEATESPAVHPIVEAHGATTERNVYGEYQERLRDWNAARAAGDTAAERQAELSMRSLETAIAGKGARAGEPSRTSYDEGLASHRAWSAARAEDPAERSQRALEAVKVQRQAEDDAAGQQLASDFFEARSALIEARKLGQDAGAAQDTYDTLLRHGAKRMRREALAAGKSGQEAEEIVASYRNAEERYLADASRNEPAAESIQPEARRPWHHRARSIGRAAMSRLGQGLRRGERTEASPVITTEAEALSAPEPIEVPAAHAAEEPREPEVTTELPSAVAEPAAARRAEADTRFLPQDRTDFQRLVVGNLIMPSDLEAVRTGKLDIPELAGLARLDLDRNALRDAATEALQGRSMSELRALQQRLEAVRSQRAEAAAASRETAQQDDVDQRIVDFRRRHNAAQVAGPRRRLRGFSLRRNRGAKAA